MGLSLPKDHERVAARKQFAELAESDASRLVLGVLQLRAFSQVDPRPGVHSGTHRAQRCD